MTHTVAYTCLVKWKQNPCNMVHMGGRSNTVTFVANGEQVCEPHEQQSSYETVSTDTDNP